MILTWVCLPKLPIHFFNQVVVNIIGNFIGRTIRMDLTTSEGVRTHYARVYIEVDLSKFLLGKYIIENHVSRMEYEFLENIFFMCGFYVHNIDSWPLTQIIVETETETNEKAATLDQLFVEGDTGSWMTIQHFERKRNNKG
ncbi:hypothetical protein LINPERHAP1_LOCUS41027 [Linum perenne]